MAKKIYNTVRTDQLEALSIQYGSSGMEEAYMAILNLARSLRAPIDEQWIDDQIAIRLAYLKSEASHA